MCFGGGPVFGVLQTSTKMLNVLLWYGMRILFCPFFYNGDIKETFYSGIDLNSILHPGKRKKPHLYNRKHYIHRDYYDNENSAFILLIHILQNHTPVLGLVWLYKKLFCGFYYLIYSLSSENIKLGVCSCRVQ